IGIGTELALNGAAAYAFANIIFEGLLFMAMGALLHRVGTVNGSDLGGLYKSMPWTTGFCIIGAASISAFPFLSGFVTKSLIISETAAGHHTLAFLALLFASAGVFHHSGIKIPFFGFFGHESGIRVKEAPLNMLIAMAGMSVLTILIGIFPKWLYAILPYPVNYEPYTITHVITQYQILLFSALAFTMLKLTGIYPPELRSTNLDSDWIYRRLAPAVVRGMVKVIQQVRYFTLAVVERVLEFFYAPIYKLAGPDGVFARTWNTGAIAFWAVLGLCLYLVFYLW
ncbi:MAG: Na(+)/H(+) antiporter subunit D, partial [bacterium]|nr:Na(+)/H(+) antiporter subunit D [bacterium]